MRSLSVVKGKSLMGSKLILTVALGIGCLNLVACSSPEEDAEARGDNIDMPANAQDVAEQAAAQSTGTGEVNSADTINNESPVEETSGEETVIVTEGEGNELNDVQSDTLDSDTQEIANEDTGTEDNDDIADGTDKEEHVSTY